MSQQIIIHPSTVPLIAGFVGGSASTVLLYPLDLVKVRLQVNEQSGMKRNMKRNNNSNSNGNKNNMNMMHRRAIVQTLRGVVRHEGWIGLYQGLGPALLGSSVSWGGYFFFYEAIKKQMMQWKLKHQIHNSNNNDHDMKEHVNVAAMASPASAPTPTLAPLENFTAACLSGSIMVGFTNPIWLIKTRMQLQLKRAQECQLKMKKASSSSSSSTSTSTSTLSVEEKPKPPYRNIYDAARTIVKEEGITALYKGTVPALMLTTHGGIQFVVYEFLKKHFGEYTRATRTSTGTNRSHGDSNSNNNITITTSSRNVFERLQDSVGYLTMGAVSKILASTATYPIQLIKSRLQQRNQMAEISPITGEVEMVRKRSYSGVVDCTVRIWNNEGLQGFFKGSLTNAIRVAPSAAITFVVYEGITDALQQE